MAITEPVQIRVRRDSLANFRDRNEVHPAGEPLHVIDDTHNDWLSGDGVRDFNTLWGDTNSIAGRAATSAAAAAGSASAAASSASSAASAVAAALAPATTTQRRAGIAVIGDSITAYNSAVGNAWHKVLAGLSGKLRHRGWFATGGYTLEQIESTHLPSVLSMSPLPGACIIAGGTNNLGATGNTGGYDPVASRATLMRIIGKLQAVGIMPVLWCPPPRDDSTTVNALTQQWGAYIRYTAQRLGLPFVDAYNAVVDPATGKYLAGAKLDDVHPNALGHYLIGKRAATDVEFLRRFNNDLPHLSMDILDAANLIPSGRGLFNQGVNGSQVPTGWAAYGGQGTNYSLSQTAATSPAVGNWQVLSMAAGQSAGGRGLQYSVTSGFQPGDRVALAVRVRSSTPDDGLSGTASIILDARSSGSTVLQSLQGGFGGTFDGVFWVDLTVPSGTDTLRANLAMNATNSPADARSVQFAQATLVNISALERA